MPRFGIDRYFNIRSAFAPTFSPDGRRVAFLTNITGSPQVWQVPAEGGWPDQLTFFPDRVGEVYFSPASDELIFTLDRGGNEHFQLYSLSGDTPIRGAGGARLESLGDFPSAMHNFGSWSRDGRQISFSANRRNPQHFDVYVRDMASGEERIVVEGDRMQRPLEFSPSGRELLYFKSNSLLDNDLFLVNLESGERRHLTPHEGEARYVTFEARPDFTPDGRSLYLVSDRGREFAALWRLDLESGEMVEVAAPEWDVETCALSPDGRWLTYTVNVDGASELHILDVAAGREVEPASLPTGVFSHLEWSSDGRSLALVVDAAGRPMDVWVLDVAGGAARQLTHSTLAGIPPETFVTPQLVHCRSFDGLTVPAWLYVPKGARPDGSLPIVMSVHGGPESQARPNFNRIIQYLVANGYAVLQPNVRGSTGYGKAYTHLDDRRKRFDSVADLKALWEWLVESGWGHPKKIAVMGGSYGGFMTLAAVTTYPELWAAGVDIVGIANFETFLEHTHPHRRYLREAEYGSLAEDREWFREVSPIYHVEKIQAAMMVIHGANDPRVPVGEAEQMVAKLRALGRRVEYLRFEDEGHGLVKIPNQIKGYSAVAEFLDRYVKSAGANGSPEG